MTLASLFAGRVDAAQCAGSGRAVVPRATCRRWAGDPAQRGCGWGRRERGAGPGLTWPVTASLWPSGGTGLPTTLTQAARPLHPQNPDPFLGEGGAPTLHPSRV